MRSQDRFAARESENIFKTRIFSCFAFAAREKAKQRVNDNENFCRCPRSLSDASMSFRDFRLFLS